MKDFVQLLWLATALAVSSSAQPVVSAVLNNASYALPGLTNSGIARGSLFAVFGTSLAPGNATATSFPIQTTMGGTSVKLTVGGSTVDCLMIYTTPGQIGAVLPSNTPTGTGQLTVTVNGQTSQPRPVNVVNSSFGIFTANQAGSGPGAIQIARSDSSRPVVSLSTPAHPGDAMIVWGTGLGPISGNDAVAPVPADLPVSIEVYVGGKQAQVTYRGRSGCCTGIDQIVFTVPQGVEGCYVPVAVRTGDIVSNFATIAVSQPDQNVCADSNGFSREDLQTAQSAGTLRTGGIVLSRLSAKASISGISTETKSDSASGYFSRYDYGQLLTAQGLGSGMLVSMGACSVATFRSTLQNPSFIDPVRPTPLDAGPAITLTRSNQSKQLTKTNDVYFADLGTSTSVSGIPNIPGLPGSGSNTPGFLEPGSYTVSAPGGSGPNAVGSFSVNFEMPALLNWTNQDAVGPITRATAPGQTVTWSGGDPKGTVEIMGMSAGTDVAAVFVCNAPASAGTFTIPNYVMLLLPATTGQNIGMLTVTGTSAQVRFNAPGLDYGYVMAIGGASKTISWR